MKYPFAEVPEEWAIHDYEGFGPINLGEYETTETVVVIAELINEHGGAFAVWYAMKRDEYGVLTSKELAEHFEESFCGEYESESDYAQELAEEIDFFSVERGSSSLGNPVDVSGAGPSPASTGTGRGVSYLMTVTERSAAALPTTACTSSVATKESVRRPGRNWPGLARFARSARGRKDHPRATVEDAQSSHVWHKDQSVQMEAQPTS